MATSEGGSARENGAGVVLGYNMELSTGVTEIPFMQEKRRNLRVAATLAIPFSRSEARGCVTRGLRCNPMLE